MPKNEEKPKKDGKAKKAKKEGKPGKQLSPREESHIQKFDFLTASGYRITGSVEILAKTIIQPVPPRPKKSLVQDHWQVTRLIDTDVMVLHFDVEKR
jgi:hypothetical protein